MLWQTDVEDMMLNIRLWSLLGLLWLCDALHAGAGGLAAHYCWQGRRAGDLLACRII